MTGGPVAVGTRLMPAPRPQALTRDQHPAFFQPAATSNLSRDDDARKGPPRRPAAGRQTAMTSSTEGEELTETAATVVRTQTSRSR